MKMPWYVLPTLVALVGSVAVVLTPDTTLSYVATNLNTEALHIDVNCSDTVSNPIPFLSIDVELIDSVVDDFYIFIDTKSDAPLHMSLTIAIRRSNITSYGSPILVASSNRSTATVYINSTKINITGSRVEVRSWAKRNDTLVGAVVEVAPNMELSDVSLTLESSHVVFNRSSSTADCFSDWRRTSTAAFVFAPANHITGLRCTVTNSTVVSVVGASSSEAATTAGSHHDRPQFLPDAIHTTTTMSGTKNSIVADGALVIAGTLSNATLYVNHTNFTWLFHNSTTSHICEDLQLNQTTATFVAVFTQSAVDATFNVLHCAWNFTQLQSSRTHEVTPIHQATFYFLMITRNASLASSDAGSTVALAAYSANISNVKIVVEMVSVDQSILAMPGSLFKVAVSSISSSSITALNVFWFFPAAQICPSANISKGSYVIDVSHLSGASGFDVQLLESTFTTSLTHLLTSNAAYDGRVELGLLRLEACGVVSSSTFLVDRVNHLAHEHKICPANNRTSAAYPSPAVFLIADCKVSQSSLEVVQTALPWNHSHLLALAAVTLIESNVTVADVTGLSAITVSNTSSLIDSLLRVDDSTSSVECHGNDSLEYGHLYSVQDSSVLNTPFVVNDVSITSCLLGLLHIERMTTLTFSQVEFHNVSLLPASDALSQLAPIVAYSVQSSFVRVVLTMIGCNVRLPPPDKETSVAAGSRATYVRFAAFMALNIYQLHIFAYDCEFTVSSAGWGASTLFLNVQHVTATSSLVIDVKNTNVNFLCGTRRADSFATLSNVSVLAVDSTSHVLWSFTDTTVWQHCGIVDSSDNGCSCDVVLLNVSSSTFVPSVSFTVEQVNYTRAANTSSSAKFVALWLTNVSVDGTSTFTATNVSASMNDFFSAIVLVCLFRFDNGTGFGGEMVLRVKDMNITTNEGVVYAVASMESVEFFRNVAIEVLRVHSSPLFPNGNATQLIVHVSQATFRGARLAISIDSASGIAVPRVQLRDIDTDRNITVSFSSVVLENSSAAVCSDWREVYFHTGDVLNAQSPSAQTNYTWGVMEIVNVVHTTPNSQVSITVTRCVWNVASSPVMPAAVVSLFHFVSLSAAASRRAHLLSISDSSVRLADQRMVFAVFEGDGSQVESTVASYTSHFTAASSALVVFRYSGGNSSLLWFNTSVVCEEERASDTAVFTFVSSSSLPQRVLLNVSLSVVSVTAADNGHRTALIDSFSSAPDFGPPSVFIIDASRFFGLQSIFAMGNLLLPPNAVHVYCSRFGLGRWVSLQQLRGQRYANVAFYNQSVVDPDLTCLQNPLSASVSTSHQDSGTSSLSQSESFSTTRTTVTRPLDMTRSSSSTLTTSVSEQTQRMSLSLTSSATHTVNRLSESSSVSAQQSETPTASTTTTVTPPPTPTRTASHQRSKTASHTLNITTTFVTPAKTRSRTSSSDETKSLNSVTDQLTRTATAPYNSSTSSHSLLLSATFSRLSTLSTSRSGNETTMSLELTRSRFTPTPSLTWRMSTTHSKMSSTSLSLRGTKSKTSSLSGASRSAVLSPTGSVYSSRTDSVCVTATHSRRTRTAHVSESNNSPSASRFQTATLSISRDHFTVTAAGTVTLALSPTRRSQSPTLTLSPTATGSATQSTTKTKPSSSLTTSCAIPVIKLLDERNTVNTYTFLKNGITLRIDSTEPLISVTNPSAADVTAFVSVSWGAVVSAFVFNETSLNVTLRTADFVTLTTAYEVNITLRGGLFRCPLSAAQEPWTVLYVVPNTYPLGESVTKATQAIVATFAGPAAALGGAAGAGSMQRASLQLQLQFCEFSLSAPLDASSSPTQLGFGSPQNYFIRGSVIGNVAIILGLTVLAGVGVGLRILFGPHPRLSFYHAAGSLAMPGWLIVPFAALVQPLVMSGLVLLINPAEATDYVIGTAGLVVCLAACGGVGAVTTKFFAARAVSVAGHCQRDPADDDAVNSEEAGAVVIQEKKEDVVGSEKQDAGNASFTQMFHGDVQPRTPFHRALVYLVHRRWEWVPQHPTDRFVKMYGPLFDVYRNNCFWFVNLEMLFSVVNGVAGGITPNQEDLCYYSQIVLCVFSGVFLIAVVVLQPYNSRGLLGAQCLSASMAFTWAVLIFFDSVPPEVTDMLSLVQVWISVVSVCLAMIDVALSKRVQKLATTAVNKLVNRFAWGEDLDDVIAKIEEADLLSFSLQRAQLQSSMQYADEPNASVEVAPADTLEADIDETGTSSLNKVSGARQQQHEDASADGDDGITGARFAEQLGKLDSFLLVWPISWEEKVARLEGVLCTVMMRSALTAKQRKKRRMSLKYD